MSPPERLTALDASFLYLERPSMHMHVAAVAVLDPSTRPDGRLPFEEVRGLVASRLHLAPRLRQRVRMVPGNIGLPLWVDDPSFDPSFHVRRAALPAPGGARELADLVQRVLSRPLDRSKPLWELTVIEGLEDGHVATLMKVHHAMVDGVSGMSLAAVLYDLEPSGDRAREPMSWRPEPEPADEELLVAAVRDGLQHPVRGLGQAAQTIRRSPALAALGLGTVVSGLQSILG